MDDNRKGVNHWRWELDFGRRPADELYDLQKDPDCIKNLATEPELAAQLAKMHEQLFATLTSQHDPRLQGEGDMFDQYPYDSPNRDFYNRWMKGERLKAYWVEETDFEAPDFDPERPLMPKASTISGLALHIAHKKRRDNLSFLI